MDHRTILEMAPSHTGGGRSYIAFPHIQHTCQSRFAVCPLERRVATPSTCMAEAAQNLSSAGILAVSCLTTSRMSPDGRVQGQPAKNRGMHTFVHGWLAVIASMLHEPLVLKQPNVKLEADWMLLHSAQSFGTRP